MEVEKFVLEPGKGDNPMNYDEITIQYSGKISSERVGSYVLMNL
jgi:hypothetical protein